MLPLSTILKVAQIQRLWRKYKIPVSFSNFHNTIEQTEIDAFYTPNSKSKNDCMNKKREAIICSIINDTIPYEYYKKSKRWNNLKNELKDFIITLCNDNDIQGYSNIKCKKKAGRRYTYDFDIVIDGNTFKVEFKYNVASIKEAPQFSSPMYPSKYMNINFPVWFYDNYLHEIAKFGNLNMPDKDEYLKTIHSNKVACMNQYKLKYDEQSKFKKFCKEVSKKAIKKFIGIAELNIKKLSTYLIDKQKCKKYMCYKDEKIYFEKMNEEIYNITRVLYRKPTNFICETKSGMTLEIRLRFKNGVGLQYPAFQIKRKIPIVKQLKQLCIQNNIKPPKLKKDVLRILDEHNIIY